MVNNAGLALGKAPAQDSDIADISVMLDTNCKAVAVLTKTVAKGMIARNRVSLLPLHHKAVTYFASCLQHSSHPEVGIQSGGCPR